MGYKRREKRCEQCGASYLAHRPSQRFCSHSCRAAATSEAARSVCSVADCENVAVTRGWCVRHYSNWKRTGDPHGWRDNADRRFWSHVDRTEGCWLWTGRLSSGGYAQFKVDGLQVMVHRWAYERFVGTIPDGLQLDHLCRVRNCVNPAHLEPVDASTNVARAAPYWERTNRPKPKCIDCGVELVNRKALRCRSCAGVERERVKKLR